MAADAERPQAAAVPWGTLLSLGLAGTPSPPQPPSPTAPVTATVQSILTQVARFLVLLEFRRSQFIENALARRGARPGDIAAAIEEDRRLEGEFARATMERLRRDMPSILQLPDRTEMLRRSEQEMEKARSSGDASRILSASRGLERAHEDRSSPRERAMRGILLREQRYAQQRVEASVARGVASVDRQRLRRESPTGAFWKLDPLVREHTVGCLLLGDKFWPWQVLNRVHPPRHPACPCRLVSYGEAIRTGLMRPGEVMNVADAVKAASNIMMERDAEADFLAAAAAAGLLEGDGWRGERRDPGGRWTSGHSSLIPPTPEAADFGAHLARALGGTWGSGTLKGNQIGGALEVDGNSVRVHAVVDHQAVTLKDIEVEKKGGGVGKKFMRELMAFADAHDYRVFLVDVQNRPFVEGVMRDHPGFQWSGKEVWREMKSRRG